MTTGLEGLAYPQWQPPGRYVQCTNEYLDYEIDWTGWLNTDSIITSQWTADQGLILSNESFTPHTASVWVSGGKAGYTYKVVNTITTVIGRISDKKLIFEIKSP